MISIIPTAARAAARTRLAWVLAWACSVAVVATWGLWQQHQAHRAQVFALQQQAQQETDRADSAETELARQRELMQTAERINRHGTQELARVRRDAAGADTERGRLLDHIADLEARATSLDARASAGGEAAAAAARMLAELQRRADERAGVLARYADEAAAAGRTCEQFADALKATESTR